MTFVSGETLYLISIGTASTVIGALLIILIQHTYRITKELIRDLKKIKEFTNDIKQIKDDISD